MLRITLGEQLSAYSAGFSAIHDSPNRVRIRPLEQIVEDAEKQGFEMVGMDIANIRGEFVRHPYNSPVILLIRQNDLAHAVITKCDSTEEVIYGLYLYSPKR